MDGTPFAALIEPYLTDRKRLGEICHERAIGIRGALWSFSDHVGRRQLRNVSPIHVESWLGTMEHLAPATRRNRLSNVRCLFAWAIKRGHCRRNPANEVTAPRQPRRPPRALHDGQVGLVLDACPDTRARLVVTLMAQQGLRCCEVSRLELGDIDWHARTMRVRGKGGHERVLPFFDETLLALDEYLGEFPASAGALVRSYTHCQRAVRPRTISEYVSGWMNDAGIKNGPRDGVSAHAHRHTCLTDMLRKGAHLRDVQAAAGHASLTTTEMYLPLLVNGLTEAMGGRTYRGT